MKEYVGLCWGMKGALPLQQGEPIYSSRVVQTCRRCGLVRRRALYEDWDDASCGTCPGAPAETGPDGGGLLPPGRVVS